DHVARHSLPRLLIRSIGSLSSTGKGGQPVEAIGFLRLEAIEGSAVLLARQPARVTFASLDSAATEYTALRSNTAIQRFLAFGQPKLVAGVLLKVCKRERLVVSGACVVLQVMERLQSGITEWRVVRSRLIVLSPSF